MLIVTVKMKYSANKTILDSDDLAQIAWDAIEPLWEDIPYSNAKKLHDFLSEVTEGQKALISIDWCQKEIRNGGMKQLLTNSTGNFVPYATEGFRLIGAINYATILEKVMSLLGSTYPLTVSGRKKALNELSSEEKAQLEELDSSFFQLIFSTEHDIEIYRGKYVKNNPQQFIKS